MNLLHAGSGLISATPRLWRRVDHRRRSHRLRQLLPDILQAAADQIGSAEPSCWVVLSSIISSTQIAVVKLGPPGCAAVAVLKIPTTRQGAASQEREALALAALTASTWIGDFEKLLPVRLAGGTAGGRAFTLERALPGSEAGPFPDRPAQSDVLAGAVMAIRGLHLCSARDAVVDAAMLNSWIDDRLEPVATASCDTAALRRLHARLHAAWAGRAVSVGWVHGDFWLGNVLVDPVTNTTTGIVDWEWAGPDELAAQDILYLCIHGRMHAQRRELGAVVAALLDGAGWEAHELALLRASGVLAADSSQVDTELLLLVWLRQIAYNLIQDPGMARNFIWVRRNLDAVLRMV